VNEVRYTIDPQADEPIMLIDSYIGRDEEEEAKGNYGITAEAFVKELLFLDTLGKSKINVWINSPGGSVTDGMAIYNAILKTKTKVDTHCVGMAASIAGVIFQAGRTRCMMDNSFLMLHNPWGSDNKQALDTMKESIIKMFCERCKLPEEKIDQLMNAESWIMADECKSLGLCDQVDSSGALNVPRKKDIKAMFSDYQGILNKTISEIKSEKMIVIKNHLKLDDKATEAEVLNKIIALQNEAAEAKNKIGDSEKMKKDLDEAKSKYDSLKAEYDKFMDEKNKLDAQNKAEADKALIAKVDELIKTAVDAGKIANEEKVVADWKAQAKASFDSVKNMIDTLPVNKKAPVKTVKNLIGEGAVKGYSAGSIMAEIAIKNKQL
jgi:ATP-dependent Clp endopeptidase proteolytic subunit ClpP